MEEREEPKEPIELPPWLVERLKSDEALWKQLQKKFNTSGVKNSVLVPWKVFEALSKNTPGKTTLVDFIRPPNPKPPQGGKKG